MTKRKTIMTSFRIEELSAVDRPAQEHALAAIVKRVDEQQEQDMRVEKINREDVASFDSLDEAVAHLRDVHKMSGADAMSAAARQRPDLLETYQRDGREAVAKVARDAADAARRRVTKAEFDFQERAEEIAKRDNVPLHVAMTRARERYPEAFDAAYRGS